jgi:hypothetical protein
LLGRGIVVNDVGGDYLVEDVEVASVYTLGEPLLGGDVLFTGYDDSPFSVGGLCRMAQRSEAPIFGRRGA